MGIESAQAPITGTVRKRSQTRTDGRPHQGRKYSAAPTSSDRLPAWQIAGLVLLAMAMIYFGIHYTSPTARMAEVFNSHLPKCFPLEDKDKVRMLGSQNTLVHRPIAAATEWAQTLFDLGLLALAGFNQIEATSMFEACLRSDPSCAMCHWGLAYAQGPMPNKVPAKAGDPFPVFTASHAAEAWRHAQAALRSNQAALGSSKLDVKLVRRDKLFVEALAERFRDGPATLKANKWKEQEARYAQRMQQIAEDTQDADAFAFAAEAFMNLSPWDYYAEDGSLVPTAATAEQLLLKALKLGPQHPHALHLHIHLAEAGSPVTDPGHEAASAARALTSANTLAKLPVQNGHLLHMPSHVYVRLGQYKKAVAANKAAYDFDLARGQQCIVPYLPEHNVNMLVYAASMAGMFHTAEAFAIGVRNLRRRLPDTWMAKGNEWVNQPQVYIRYGQWDKLLFMPAPPKDARGVTELGGPQYAMVVYHTGRLLAMAARSKAAAQQILGLEDETAFDLARKSLNLREKEIEQEHRQLQQALGTIPNEPLTKPGAPPGMYASGYRVLATIASNMVEARLTLLRDNTAGAIELLRESVRLEDSLGYMEPPRVHQPVRQCLGWLLLQAGQLDEAWKVYSQDVRQHPSNGWSLLGLKQVAEARGDGVADAAALFKAAWTDSEVSIDSSCPALAQPYIK